MGLFQSYQRLVTRWASGRTVLILLIAAMAVYAYMVFVSIPSVMAFEGNLRLLDMKPLGYDMDYVRLLFHSLGTEGRQVYLTGQLPIDMIYPALFALSGCFLLAFLFKRVSPSKPGLFGLTVIPLLAGLTDYAENIGIITMLRSFPDLSPGIVQITSALTIGKSSLTMLFWLIMMVGLIVALTRKQAPATGAGRREGA